MAVTMTLTEYKNFLEKKLKEANAIERKIDNKIKEKYKSDLDKIIKSAIDVFYHSYKPKYYHRKYSLKYMYDIKVLKKNMQIDFDPNYSFAHHRLGNEGIYELAFKGGYHGGALGGKDHPNPGTPYWRTPYPEFTEWGYPAVKSEPPFNIVKRKVKEYEKTAESVLDELIDYELRKWLG